MKGIILIGLLWMHCLPQGIAQQDTLQIRLMTFNIRYDNPSDGEYGWEKRKELVVDLIRQQSLGILGLQEVLHHQLRYMLSALPQYAWYGVGRDDGYRAGEFAPILFDSSRFVKIRAGTFWLSESPGCPGSISWEAACTRIVTWIHVRERGTGQQLVVFNTHFDHVSEEARNRGAQLLLKMSDSIAGITPSILMGDFNTTAGTEAYKILTSKYINTITKPDNQSVSATWIGFPADLHTQQVIDFIFYSPAPSLGASEFTICTYNKEGFYPSDHLPVVGAIHIISTKTEEP